MPTKSEIMRRIGEWVEEISLGAVPAGKCESGSRFVEDLHLDSLDVATLILRLERWLQIQLSEEDVDWSRFQTLGEMAAWFFAHAAHGDSRT